MDVKKDFPIFEANPNLVYLDSAATSQRPQIVIDAMNEFQTKDNANAGRGVYDLSEAAMKRYGEARKAASEFIGAEKNEIVFTLNTTMALNQLAYTIETLLEEGRNEIVLSQMEHHSNIVCWQELAKRKNFKIKFIKVTDKFELDFEDAGRQIGEKTALVSICHVSNVLGTKNDVKKICSLSRGAGALSIIDAAQSVGHINVSVKEIGCDFLVFSSHKMLGPSGAGVLWGKEELLEKLPPFLFGGGMINFVDFEKSTWADLPEKFEAGTQNIMEVIGLKASVEYLNEIGVSNIEKNYC